MNIKTKIPALFTAAFIALSVTACGRSQHEGGVQTSGNPAPAGLEKLMSKYENDLLNDIKNNGLSSDSAPQTVTGWDPDAVKKTAPEIGGDAVLSSVSLDGVDVSLIAHDITHLPDKTPDNIHHTEDCCGCLCAERVLLYLKDGEGRKALSTQINSISPGHHRISGECIFDGCTRICKTEQGGETYYLLMQFAEYDKENDALLAAFYVLDMELYDLSAVKDENGISCGGLWIIGVNAPEGKRIGGWGQAYQASKEFEYRSGTTFYDPVYGYEITFDMKRGSASVAYPNE